MRNFFLRLEIVRECIIANICLLNSFCRELSLFVQLQVSSELRAPMGEHCTLCRTLFSLFRILELYLVW